LAVVATTGIEWLAGIADGLDRWQTVLWRHEDPVRIQKIRRKWRTNHDTHRDGSTHRSG